MRSLWPFVGIYGILAWLNCRKLATTWDEFSHWMDAVKTMTPFNDFGIKPPANIGVTTLVVAFLAAPKIAWRAFLTAKQASLVFSQPYDFPLLFRVLTGQDTSYRVTVWKSFMEGLFSRTLNIPNLGISIPCFALCVLLPILLWHSASRLVRKQIVSDRNSVLVLSAICAEIVIYLLGMGLTYITRFSEFEAVHLASFERCMNICFLGCWVV